MRRAGSIVKKTVKAAAWTAVALLIAVLFFLLLGSRGQKLPFLNGIRVLNVMSGSMEGAIPTGSVVIVADKEPLELIEGDIITFISNDPLYFGKVVTHRIVEIADYRDSVMFITKGDANEDKDGAAALPANVIGKVVFHIPLLGYLLNFLKTKLGFFLVCLLPCMVIFLLELLQLARHIGEYRREKKSGESAQADCKADGAEQEPLTAAEPAKNMTESIIEVK